MVFSEINSSRISVYVSFINWMKATEHICNSKFTFENQKSRSDKICLHLPLWNIYRLNHYNEVPYLQVSIFFNFSSFCQSFQSSIECLIAFFKPENENRTWQCLYVFVLRVPVKRPIYGYNQKAQASVCKLSVKNSP